MVLTCQICPCRSPRWEVLCASTLTLQTKRRYSMRVFSLAFQSHLHFKMTICLCGWEGCNQFEINNSTVQPSPSPSPKPTTPKPTPKPTPTPTPKPGLQCLKCNGVPNPGNPNPDACDADQHFGDLTVTKPFSQLYFDMIIILS